VTSPFPFWLNTNMRFGAGIARELPDHLQQLGVTRMGVVVDANVATTPVWKSVVERLSGFHVAALLENAVAEPDYDYLDECKDRFVGRDLDCVIGVGGGSTLDLAKALSVLTTNPGPAISYRGFDRIKHPGPPLVAVPTTAGTGSEVTPNAVFTDKKEMRKLGINTALYVPKLVLLDPLLTLSCPRSVTVSAGMDALVHTLESYVAKKASPLSRVFSREAFSLIFNALPKVVAAPENAGLRAQMQLGAYDAGIALMNSGAGLAGAMSYPLGVRFGVPHGLAGAVFLSHVVRFNSDRGCDLYGDLCGLIQGAAQAPSHRPTAAAEFCTQLDSLCERLAVPRTLRGFGVSPRDISALAEETMLLRGAIEQNPVDVSVGDVRDILQRTL
jgi:alcohol dehydrogenase